MDGGIFKGEIEQLQGRFVIGESAAGFNDLAQRTMERLHRVGRVDHFAYPRREGPRLKNGRLTPTANFNVFSGTRDRGL